MIKEEGPISSYLEKKGLKGKQIFQKWKDSPIRQDLKDIQTGAIDKTKGGLEHAKDFASKAAETARQVASGEATKRVVTVTGPGPTDYKVDIPSNKKTNDETGTTPTPAKTETPKTETPKTETPPAGSAAAKMSFVDAYNKARQMAKAAGKDENLAQFKFDRGGGEKVYQAAATKADYVPMKQQFAVDINAPTTKTSDVTPKSVKTTSVQTPVSGPDISSKPREGTKYPADATGVTPSPVRDVSGSEGAKYPASGGVRQSTGTFEKGPGYAVIREPKTESGGKKKVSEENDINEVVTREQLAKSGLTLGQYLNKQRGLTAVRGGANDPSSAKFKGPATSTAAGQLAKTSTAMRSMPDTLAGRNQAKDTVAAASSERGIRSYSGGNIDVNKFNAPGGNRSTTLPTKSDTPSDLKPVSGDQKSDLIIGDTLRGSGHSDLKLEPFKRPEIVAKANQDTNTSYESGGKKKKMSEENNPLIDMFLKLQEKNTLTPNIFEAAKKAKKDHDGDGKIESEKDEVWGSRFRAARAAGKMEEAEVDYSAPDRPAVTKDNKPSTPAQTNASTSGPSDADKKALDSKIKTIAKEEVSFSEAELAFFASVFEAVAPNRPEPTKGVNPTVRDTELTDETIAEGRPRKNPTPETTERDARQHIQVQAGRAAGGTVVDFKHDNGKISKLTPGMGRSINAHLNALKPAERQEAVKRMHASPEGLKV